MKQERIHQANKFNSLIQYTYYPLFYIYTFSLSLALPGLSGNFLIQELSHFFYFILNTRMQDNIPSHTPFNPREISMPAQKNSYLSNSHISKPKFHPTKSEPENRAQQKKQAKHPQQSSIQKINKASQKKHRNKKLDIKKLIQQKQARENLHKSGQQKEEIKTNKVYKLFESTDHPSIDRCLICGYIVFNSNISQRARLKLEHAKKEHCQYPFIDKKSVEIEINNDQYTKMAGELVYFANDRDNRELMEYVLGQYIPQPFKAYVEPMQVKTQWKKWAKVVQDVFKIHS